MTTAGEAASLFGGADSANDPFALAIQEEPQVSGNDPFASLGPSSPAADLFDSATTEGTAFLAEQEYVPQQITTEAPNGTWSAPNSHTYAPAEHYGYGQQEAYSSQPAANGWHDNQGQWANGSQAQYNTVNGKYAAHSYAPAAPATGAYAAYPTNTYTPPSVSQASSAETSYANYAPASQSYSSYSPTKSTYASPSTTTYAASYEPSYDPYKPSQGASRQAPPAQPAAPAQLPHSYAQFLDGATGESSAVPRVDMPPRSTASAASYRPKTLNAYDPPIPPPKTAPKRPAAWQSPMGSSAQLGYASIPNSPPPRTGHTPALPPPPRKASVPPPPPRTGSAARQYISTPTSPPASTMSPPPRTTSAARHFAPPPPPISAYSPPSPHPVTTWNAPAAAAPAVVNAYTHGAGAAAPQSSDQPATSATEAHSQESYWDDPESNAVPVAGSAVTSNGVLHEEAYDPEAVVEQDSPVSAADGLPEEETIHFGSSAPVSGVDTNSASFDQVSSWTGNDIDDESTAPEAHQPVNSFEDDEPVAQPTIPDVGAHASEPVHDPYRPTTLNSHSAPPPANNPYFPPTGSSWHEMQTSESTQIHPTTISSPPASVPNSRSSLDSYAAPPNPYQPSSAAGVQRTSSPSSFSVRSIHSVQSIRDPYSPPEPTARYRSASNGSAFSLSTSQNDPYAPGAHSRQQSTESYTFEAGLPKPTYGNDVPSGLPNGVPQVQTLTAPHRTPYAPSPSLLGTNDPLGRTAVRIPVITFGFGGKLVTCFHGSDMQTGFEVAMSSRASTSVHIRSLHSVIPQSALEVSTASYPGPLFSDPGTPAATLVRTGAAAQLKAKKAKVVKYLEERSEEISQGLGYLHQGSVDLHRALAKRILINLLKVMVENDGRLSGTPQIDTAVRAALLPNTESSPDASTATLVTPAAGTFELASSSYGSLGQLSHDMKGTKLADHPLWSSQLDKIESFLVRGDRRGAFHYAADEKLWAHAFLIASSIDKEAWKEAVTEFVRSELRSAGAGAGLPTGLGGKSVNTDSREPLRVAYSLFAGQGGACVQELHPTKPLGASNHSLPVAPPTLTTVTPISAAFQQVVQPVTLPQDTLAKWPTTAAMIISGSLPTDCSAALTALGDHLALNNWIEAAHACYLLSPQTSPVGGVGTPGARVVLYGVPNPQVAPGVYKDPDAIIFSEIVEFAMSLTPPAKGQDAFNGLPHLQPYRLLRALQLAELGHMDLANRYCEAISHSTPRSSPYLNAVFLDELKGLSDRLVAAPLLDKSGSWMGSKMARPSLDKIGNWLEGRFTSFIAGEGDSPHPVESQEKVSALSGPFAHYSTISSATNSTMPSPQMSSTNLAESYPVAPPFRTGSAMALRTSTTSPAQIARASSAVDYLRRKPSPVPRGSSAGGSAYGLASKSQVPYGYPNGFNPSPTEEMTTPTAQDDASGSGPRVASWWGSAESQSATPTATSFPHPDGSLDQSSEGFISLMDDAALAGPHTTSQFAAASRMNSLARDDIDEDDDLGLGNSGNRSKKAADTPAEDQKKAAPPPSKSEPVKEADKSAAPAGGWLSRLWKRNEGGPVKANLGDENTFYYDAETKRWVNKNAPSEPAKASPPPPPQRSQTASPGMSAARAPPISPAGPPPARPASAIDLTEGPPKKPPMRVRSNLVPLEATSAPNTPASATLPRTPNTMMDGPPGMDAPPTPGQRRAPIKRNARSRYVDVFQEPGS